MLAEVAPVFLWSFVGAENGTRLLREFAELRPYVKGATASRIFRSDTVELAYAIDDEALDEPVLACHRVGLCDSGRGGADTDDLLHVASAIVAELRADPECG